MSGVNEEAFESFICDKFGVLWPGEVERTVALLLAEGPIAHDRVHAALAPAIDRFADLDDDEQARFLDGLQRFIRTYGFSSQVVAFTDTKLERTTGTPTPTPQRSAPGPPKRCTRRWS
jgi:hypothetical protein